MLSNLAVRDIETMVHLYTNLAAFRETPLVQLTRPLVVPLLMGHECQAGHRGRRR